MINIVNKELCCGCEACVQICPKCSISFCVDDEGFYYPSVDSSTCVLCGLCEKVCPVINMDSESLPLEIYAAKNKNEQIRKESSSGGVFTLIAETVINKGGVVFGAKFNEDWNVEHTYVETIQELNILRGSKYVQSRIRSSYIDVKKFLNDGRDVLFTGTSCQISGLRKYLGRDYDNLLLVDIICHGVPSPMIWNRYKRILLKQYEGLRFNSINFRDKSKGWKGYSFSVEIESDNGVEFVTMPFSSNIYMNGFLRNIYLRPSCYKCPSKSAKSGADITIADFWGVGDILPEFDDNKGTSMVIISTTKGYLAYKSLGLDNDIKVDASTIQKPYFKSSNLPHNRAKFFKSLNNNDNDFIDSIRVYIKPNLIKRILICILGRKLIGKILRIQ